MAELRDGRTGPVELAALIILALSLKLFLELPRDMAIHGRTAGWLLILAAGAAAGPGVAALAALARRFPGLTVPEMAGRLWGAPARLAAGVALSLMFVAAAALQGRQLVDPVLTVILPATPAPVLAAGWVAVAAFAAHRGVEALGRAALTVVPWYLGATALVVLGTLPYSDYRLLAPLWGPGLVPLAAAALPKSSHYAELALLGLVIPYLDRGADAGRAGWRALAVAAGLATAAVAQSLMVFPDRASEEATFTFFQVAEVIFLGRFVQRLETLVLLVWGVTATVAGGALLYGAVQGLARGAGMPVWRPLVFPVAGLVYTVTFLPADVPAAVAWSLQVLRRWAWTAAFALPLALALWAHLFGERRQAGAP